MEAAKRLEAVMPGERKFTLTQYPAFEAYRSWLEGTGTLEAFKKAPTYVTTTYICSGYADCGSGPCAECIRVERKVGEPMQEVLRRVERTDGQ